ncbi:MAG: DNA-3-methyladenine glycosylase 2 family protein [Rhodocyclaceae bacterium]|nr:MAG: DNA-3-methyladenine glycosylase 2 family protein [Rhodocyclaceae bacterium]
MSRTLSRTTLYRNAGKHLAAIDDDWALLLQRVGPCRMQMQEEREPYEALIRAVASQQIHGKAAAAIIARFLALYRGKAFPSPKRILATDFDTLRACGFSARKVETIQGIAQGALADLVPSRAEAETLDDETLIARLVQLKGIGRWTVEMLLMFTLGRSDILPVDDFGVREGYRLMKGLPAQPKPKALGLEGLAWSPHRSIAAWYLWRANEVPEYRRQGD